MGRMITYEMLEEKGACEKQLELFLRLFPNGVEVTEELCEQYGRRFDLWWAAEKLLSPTLFNEYLHIYDTARAEYHVTRNTEWTRYRDGTSTLLEYSDTCDAAKENIAKASEKAFVRLYNSES